MWRRIAVATISLAVVNRMAQSIINSMCCKVTWQFATSGIKIKFNSTVCTTTLEHLQTPMFINVFINYFSSSFSVLSFVTFNLVFKIVNYQILKHLFAGFIMFEKYIHDWNLLLWLQHTIAILCSPNSLCSNRELFCCLLLLFLVCCDKLHSKHT